MSLPVVRAADIEESPCGRRWLIEGLWVDQGVGIIGGQPKCCKSFLALDMAVAIASGKPCLRHYAVENPGTVLLYAAEDALHVVKRRLSGICQAAGVALGDLDIQVITASAVRLDQDQDRLALTQCIKDMKPTILILDPFIRLHRIDENSSGEVAAILAYLRILNRTYGVAVAVVHHARKRSDARAGQSLRGSSEFHAWGDSNLYLQRDRDDLISLSIEHRSEHSETGISLELRETSDALALHKASTSPNPQPQEKTAEERIMESLLASPKPMSLEDLREACRLRRNTVCDGLRKLMVQGTVSKNQTGYSAINN